MSVLNAYHWNKRFVFEVNKGKDIRSLVKTFISYDLTFILSTLLLFVMVNQFGVSEIVAPI